MVRLLDELHLDVRLGFPEVFERLVAGLLEVRLRVGSPFKTLCAPLIIHHGLQTFHLLIHRLLRHLLHPRVDGGVDDQALGVEVASTFSGPLAHPVPDVLGEVRGQACVKLRRVVVGLDGLGERLVVLGPADEAHAQHIAQHHVAPLAGPRRVADWVVAADGLKHPDERRALIQVEFARVFAVEREGGGLDAEGVAPELDRVQVHLDNLALGVVPLQLDRRHHLLELPRHRHVAPDLLVVEVAGKLLRDRRSSAQIAFPEDVRDGREDAFHIDAPVALKAVVFGRDECPDSVGRDLVERGPRAVLPGVAGQELAVGGVGDGGEVERGVLDGLRGRRITCDHQEAEVEHDAEPMVTTASASAASTEAACALFG